MAVLYENVRSVPPEGLLPLQNRPRTFECFYCMGRDDTGGWGSGGGFDGPDVIEKDRISGYRYACSISVDARRNGSDVDLVLTLLWLSVI